MGPAALCRQLDELLQVDRYSDASLNGLQLDAGVEIRHVVCGVSANAALIDQAIERHAQLIVVHHGLLWGRCERLTGLFGHRVKRLYEAGISLAGYHLPLDAHPELGNNAGLARCLSLQGVVRFGDYKGMSIGWGGPLPQPSSLGEVNRLLRSAMGDISHCFGSLEREIRRVAVCSGAASDLVHEAAAAEYDLFITGEVEEWTQAQALELGISVIAGGHHRTERFGVESLSDHLNALGDVTAEFVDIPNPV